MSFKLVEKILSYLPSSDLLSATLVNRLWEAEARKLLLNPISLACFNVDRYFDTRGPQPGSSASFILSFCDKPRCFKTMTQSFEDNDCSHKVTSVSMEWALNTRWVTDFQDISQFDNFKTLELTPTRRPHVPYGHKNYTKFPSARIDTATQEVMGYLSFTLPSVSSLVWDLSSYNATADEDLTTALALPDFPAPHARGRTLIPSFMEMVPNVSRLEFRNFGGQPCHELVQNCLSLLPKVTQLICLTSKEKNAIDQITHHLKNLHLPIILTRLEFNMFKHRGNWVSWDGVLVRLASSLKHLTIRGVRQVWPGFVPDLCTLLVPILPKLTVLEIAFSPGNVNPADLRRFCSQRVAELDLGFETATPDDVSLYYAAQFPMLRRLEIKSEPVGSPFGNEATISDNAWIETCLRFLSSYFLPSPSVLGPCTSLRILVLPPSPPNVKQKSAKFYERVMATFPNIKNLESYRHY